MEYNQNNDELMHYKYISRKKVNGKWQYQYEHDAASGKSLSVQDNTQKLRRPNQGKNELVSGPRKVTKTAKLSTVNTTSKTAKKETKKLSNEAKVAKRVKLGKDVLKKYGLG